MVCSMVQYFIKCTKLEKRDQKQMLLLLDGHSIPVQPAIRLTLYQLATGW